MTRLQINNKTYAVDAAPDTPLLWVLRDELGLVGTKYGCGVAQCGACTVHVDGNAMRSCQIWLEDAAGAQITTVEELAGSPVGRALQDAWRAIDVAQCGYCQAGQLMSAAALLSKTPQPSDQQIEAAMNGNICRCGTYVRIKEAIKQAATDLTRGQRDGDAPKRSGDET